MQAEETFSDDRNQAEEWIVAAFRAELDRTLKGRPDSARSPLDDREVFRLADEAVRDYYAAAATTPTLPSLSRARGLEIRQRLYATNSALGPLGELLALDGVEDIHINGTRGGYLEYGDHQEPLPVRFDSEEELALIVRYYAERVGKHFDSANPLVTITLRDGSRLAAIGPPVARPLVVTIRKQQVHRFLHLSDLERERTIPRVAVPLLEAAVRARLNVVLSGPTGCGKTTFARILAMLIPAGERTCVLETETELWLHDLREEDFFSLEEREANVEGAGRITLQDLFQRGALRQRPRRIIVGEVRGREALDMIHAMQSGHDGSLSTVHASGPRAATSRLQMLAMSADPNLSPEVVGQMVGSGVDLLLQLEIYQRGDRLARRLESLCFVDQNVENPSIGPMLQEVCRYRVGSDSWDWVPSSVRFMPAKIEHKFTAAGIDTRSLPFSVTGDDER